MQWIGYAGLISLAICWIPQSIETIKQGRCTVNLTFLALSAVGSFSLLLYAASLRDPIFITLNCLTTLGAAVNMFYKFFPRKTSEGTA
jgi:MtN3 and saliva related transmembrane protein